VRNTNSIFNIAFDLDKLKNNEKVITSIQMNHNPNNVVKDTQIAGLMDRRVDNKNNKSINSNVKIGDTLGIKCDLCELLHQYYSRYGDTMYFQTSR
jgi:hypothetical protein